MKTKLASRSVLSPGHLGTGRNETSGEESPAPLTEAPRGEVKLLRSVPGAREGFQAQRGVLLTNDESTDPWAWR